MLAARANKLTHSLARKRNIIDFVFERRRRENRDFGSIFSHETVGLLASASPKATIKKKNEKFCKDNDYV
ncbi:hypothetical protein HHO37_04955 [Streptococcus ursoris]|uniref:Uncharacterized protein n=1 Tax=Streptococcus ratti TaxID=1341 RepID=A0A7X9LDA8_STRRT|nr:hypothetical protein [Streptococcus ratti]